MPDHDMTPPEQRVTATRIIEALLIAGITASVSVYAAVEVTQRDVQHLTGILSELSADLKELRREMRPLYSLQTLERRIQTAEDRLQNLASRVRDLEAVSPRAGQDHMRYEYTSAQ